MLEFSNHPHYNHLESMANIIATFLALCISLVLVLCVFWAFYSTLPEQIFPGITNPNQQKNIVTVSAVSITAILGFAGTFWGVSIIGLYKKIKEKLFKEISSYLKGDN